MIKIIGPGHSQSASGQLAKALTYGKTKTINFAKKHATPKNPRSPKQQSIRAAMSFLATEWRNLTPTQQATWNDLALANRHYPYHAFIKENQNRWKTFRSPTIEYPAAESTTMAGPWNFTATGYVGRVMIRAMNYLMPANWGYFIYRSQTWPFTPNHDNVVQFALRVPGTKTEFFNGPLPPGLYYYRLSAFTFDGLHVLHPNGRAATVT